MRKSKLPSEEIVRLYRDEGLGCSQIAERAGVVHSSILRMLHRRGIFPTRRAPLNRITIDGDIAQMEITMPRGDVVVYALVDAAAVPKFLDLGRRWWATFHHTTGQYMAQANVRTDDGKWTRILLHRFVTDAPDGVDVDHRNHNMLDCRRENLRFCTRSQNLQNRDGAQRNSTSGIRGVSWDSRRKKWVAHVTLHSKTIHLGRFGTKEQAEAAAIAGRQKYMTHSPECVSEVSAIDP